ncbi:RsmB/NOP family class I SAM-dependent RNA methyltransferase [Guyparkeria hydrothermalis]|uniref:RsmB/NOP family class I SAM-dependent RNA methyltransferase n=1 Tax=Guyparkeria hydrothermalis TaxID=923 RepID=UPI0020220B4E|nr:RsmB/NOP family class I SAM-dependent RNA methyltransferase [Guyparkeria hydrothermalis]MCL7745033.1 RsmB/NOP family class I SAM-dependent RNA methyltransferase [Guyparkeria hydrothermalis]
MSDPTPDSSTLSGNDWPAPALPRGRPFPAQLQLAAELLERIGSEGLPADRVLQRELATQRRMGKRDRERVRELTLFVLRQRRVLDWLLDRDQPDMAMRVAAALLLADALDPVLAASAGLGENDMARLAERRNTPFPELPTDIRFNLTADAAAQWNELAPADPEALAQALESRAPIDLHANPRCASAAALRTELAEADIEATPIDGLPLGLRLQRPARLTRLPAFERGAFEIQDAGSQWVVRAVGAQAGDRILDLCAGAGGKSLGLLDETDGNLDLTACDLHADRLERLRARARRHGDLDLKLHAADATRPLPDALGQFDHVLIDAPCSGSGTWRRHPELRWAAIDWPDLATTQRQLLEQGAAVTRPGGRLIYATCSLWPAENEAVVADFLAGHPGWQAVIPGDIGLPDDAITRDGWVRLRPDRHGCDGFFIACLQAP